MGNVNRAKVIAAAHKHLAKGNLRKAIKEYEKLLKEDPADIRTKLKVGDLFFRLGEKDRAVRTFEEVARFYSDQGFLLKSVAVYKQVQKMKPDDIGIHLALAELYRQIGLAGDAITQYRQAIMLQKKAGLSGQRLETARRMVELDQDNARLRISLAEELSNEGMVDESVAEFRAAYKILRDADLIDESILVAERLLYHQPDDWEISKFLAQQFIERKDGLKALSRLQVCFKGKPDDPEVLELLAQVFEFLGQPHKAATVLKSLARIYERSGLRIERDNAYAVILRLVPGDKEAAQVFGSAERPVRGEEYGQEIVFENGGNGASAARRMVREVPPVPDREPDIPPEPDDIEIPIDDQDEATNPEAQVPTAFEPGSRPLDSSAFPGQGDDDMVSVGQEPEGRTVVQSLPFLGGAVDLSGVPQELHDDVQSLEFMIDAGLEEEAWDLLQEMKQRAGNLPCFEKYGFLKK
ncbi:tetratricopeptide repeat protein [Myxococcota bacterium]|nr:tetratricopeptide repeat protein [Myxococcota bacterium]